MLRSNDNKKYINYVSQYKQNSSANNPGLSEQYITICTKYWLQVLLTHFRDFVSITLVSVQGSTDS